jgi:hypothetical protein
VATSQLAVLETLEAYHFQGSEIVAVPVADGVDT